MLLRQNIVSSNNRVSNGTFFKHLPVLIPIAFFRYGRCCTVTKSATATAWKSLSTSCVSNSRSHFETFTSRQKDQINIYVNALLERNKRMNLTAITEVNEVMERHVEDSLAVLTPLKDYYHRHCSDSCGNIKLVDVGTGPGLPGMIFAIACPGWEVTLMESMNKRCVFLEHATNIAGLRNVKIVRGRAEDLGQNLQFREKFDVAVARAVAEMRVLAEYCLPLVRVGGMFIAAKGHNPEEEVRNAEKAICEMGAEFLEVCSDEWTLKVASIINGRSKVEPMRVESHSPYGQRTAVVILKDRSTPGRYPRRPALNQDIIVSTLKADGSSGA